MIPSDKEPIHLAILNRSQLVILVEGEIDLLASLVDIFAEEYPRILKELKEAVRIGDAKRMQQAAHSMKGVLRTLAGDRSAQLAECLEQMGREGKTEGSEVITSELESTTDALQVELRQFLSQAKAANSFDSLKLRE